MKKTALLIGFLIITQLSLAQALLETKVSIPTERPLIDFLVEFESKNPVRFFFLDEWLSAYSISPEQNGKTLQEALQSVLADSGVSFTFLYGYAIVFIKDPSQILLYKTQLRNALVGKQIIEKIVIGNKGAMRSARNVRLTGTIRDDLTQKALSDVVLSFGKSQQSSTDANGNFSVSLKPGEHIITIQLSGYRSKTIDLSIYESGTADFLLEDNPRLLEEIEVSDQAIVTKPIGQTNIKIADIKRSPTFLGEIDIIKQVQSQPGVTSVGEIATGFNVRGGGVDQNLVLYDGVPILNTSHALGFFTAFNSDVVKTVNFFRGGIPAEFGGRVSSVLDIKSKEGDPHKWKGGGGIGIISSYLTIGGPIKKDTTTVIASVRTSYSDRMLDVVKSNYKDLSKSSLSFYDGSLKLSHKLSEKTKLTMSGYTSYDDFKLTNDTLYATRNIAGSVKLEKVISTELFASAALSYGSYAYQISDNETEDAFKLGYRINYPSLKVDFVHDRPHKIQYGLHSTYYNFHPGYIEPASSQSDVTTSKIDQENSIESALYLSDEFSPIENLQISGGLRYSLFNRIGAGKTYFYKEGAPRELRNVEDSVKYDRGEIMKTYHGLEPRLFLQYQLNDERSVKLGYHRIYQYLHLITNTAAVTPIDIWQSSNAYFKPQIADQVSAGYYQTLRKGEIETFAELFYKKISNTLDFKDGAQLILNKNIETSLVSGNAKAYGLEVSVAKVKGRLTGNLNYTYSRSLRTTPGLVSAEAINEGQQYAANYDQPHIANMNWRYGISRRIFFSGNFTYHTGRPVSLPGATYVVDGVTIQDFPERNGYRIPDYHRLDVAFIFEGNHKLKKLWDGTWIFSFYNVYARKNAYSVFFQKDENGVFVPYKLSVVGTVIPSISYSFKF